MNTRVFRYSNRDAQAVSDFVEKTWPGQHFTVGLGLREKTFIDLEIEHLISESGDSVIVSNGMGARVMNNPSCGIRRAELVMYLSDEMEVEGRKGFHPRFAAALAQMHRFCISPFEQGEGIGRGTIFNVNDHFHTAFGYDFLLCVELDESLKLENDEVVYLTLIPLYVEEAMELANTENGIEAFLNALFALKEKEGTPCLYIDQARPHIQISKAV